MSEAAAPAVETRVEFEIEFNRFDVWQNLDRIIHGAGHAPTLDAANLEVERVKSIAKVDPYYDGLQYRIVRVTREVIEP